MAEKCVVIIKDEEQQQQQKCASPLVAVISDASMTSTPTTTIDTGVSTTASASSTPTQSGVINCDGQSTDADERGNGYVWFYMDKNATNGGHHPRGQIQLETPAVEERNSGGLNVAKPKRLSDEFYSADDDYEDDEDDELNNGNAGGDVRRQEVLKNEDIDCGVHASLSLREIQNLSITNGGAETGEDGFERENSVYISEETSSCSSGHRPVTVEGSSTGLLETDQQQQPEDGEDPLRMEQDDIVEDEGVAVLENDMDEDGDDGDVDEDDLHDVQSIDAIERRDFEQEQKLTGGIIKNSAFIPDNHRLNLEFISRIKKMRDDTQAKKSQPDGKIQLTSTPTSSRHPCSSSNTSNREQNGNSTTKSSVKVNLTASLESYCVATEAAVAADIVDGPSCSSSMASSSSSSVSISSKTLRRQQQQQLDAFLNSNSNDSLSSDRSIFIPNLQVLKQSSKDSSSAPNSSSVNEPCTSSSSSSPSPSSASSAGPSTSGTTKPPSDCSLSSCATSVIKQTGVCSKNINHHPVPSTSASNSSLYSFSCPFGSADRESGEGCSSGSVSLARFPSSVSNFGEGIVDEAGPTSSSHRNRQQQLHHERAHVEDPLLEPSQLSMPPELAAAAAAVEHECDEDNWADCEEGSDEEICTCRDYTDDETNAANAAGHASSEDELPSRDVDLSSYTHMDVAEDILAHDPRTGAAPNSSGNNAQTPRLHRKRKLTENRILFGSGGNRCMGSEGNAMGKHCDSPSSESLNFSSRKRLALDSSPRTLLNPSNVSPSVHPTNASIFTFPFLQLTQTPTSSSLGERKTPRSIIPTKDNPPPELNDWLQQFQVNFLQIDGS